MAATVRPHARSEANTVVQRPQSRNATTGSTAPLMAPAVDSSRLMKVKVLFTVRHQPGPNGVSSPPQSCISRLSHPVQVHVLPTSIDDGDTLLGEISLKTCIGTICVSRPELVAGRSLDFAISALDIHETQMKRRRLRPRRRPSGANSSPLPLAPRSSSTPGGPSHRARTPPTSPEKDVAAARRNEVYEGKGMMSWAMAERGDGRTRVTGRVLTSASGELETLEVDLQLAEHTTFTQVDFVQKLRTLANPPAAPGHNPLGSPSTGDFMSRVYRINGLLAHANPSSAMPETSTSSSSAPAGKVPVERHANSTHARTASGVPPRPRLIASTSAPANVHTPLTSTTAATAASTVTTSPDVMSLVQKLLPSLVASATANPAESSALVPAVCTLLQYFGNGGGSMAAAKDTTVAPVIAPEPKSDPVQVANAVAKAPPAGRENRGPRARKRTSDTMSASDAVDVLASDADAMPIDEHKTAATGQKARKVRVCANCGTTNSASWRRLKSANALDGHRLCNACGQHHNKHGKHRPVPDAASGAEPARKKKKSTEPAPSPSFGGLFSKIAPASRATFTSPPRPAPSKRRQIMPAPSTALTSPVRSTRARSGQPPATPTELPPFVMDDSPGTALNRILGTVPVASASALAANDVKKTQTGDTDTSNELAFVRKLLDSDPVKGNGRKGAPANTDFDALFSNFSGVGHGGSTDATSPQQPRSISPSPASKPTRTTAGSVVPPPPKLAFDHVDHVAFDNLTDGWTPPAIGTTRDTTGAVNPSPTIPDHELDNAIAALLDPNHPQHEGFGEALSDLDFDTLPPSSPPELPAYLFGLSPLDGSTSTSPAVMDLDVPLVASESPPVIWSEDAISTLASALAIHRTGSGDVLATEDVAELLKAATSNGTDEAASAFQTLLALLEEQHRDLMDTDAAVEADDEQSALFDSLFVDDREE